MLKIRLQRVGRKNDPSFRVVCVDSKKGPKSGNNVEILGSYDSRQNRIAVKSERVKHWISKGVQVSDTVNNLLVKEGIIKGKKIHVSRGKKNTRDSKVEEIKEVSSSVQIATDKPTKEEAPIDNNLESNEKINTEEEKDEETTENVETTTAKESPIDTSIASSESAPEENKKEE